MIEERPFDVGGVSVRTPLGEEGSVIGGEIRSLRPQVWFVTKPPCSRRAGSPWPSTSYQVLTPGSSTYSPTAHLLNRSTKLTYDSALRSAPRTAIHLSAWKANSPKLNFRFTEFSEVRIAPVQHL